MTEDVNENNAGETACADVAKEEAAVVQAADALINQYTVILKEIIKGKGYCQYI
jgi:hypothetical protein